jgi:hypothetical protein
VVNGGWLPLSPNLVKCRLRRHSANPLVRGPYLVNRDLLDRPNYIILHTRLPLWWVLCQQVRLSAPERGGRVGPVVPNPGDGGGAPGGGRVLALQADLVLELGFSLNLDLGLAPRTGPFLCSSIP